MTTTTHAVGTGLSGWRVPVRGLIIAAALLCVMFGLGRAAAAAGCPEGGRTCLERAWEERDRCLASCQGRFSDLAAGTETGKTIPQDTDCKPGCLRRRKTWWDCCEKSTDCGASCRF